MGTYRGRKERVVLSERNAKRMRRITLKHTNTLEACKWRC